MTIPTRALALPQIDHKGLEGLVRATEDQGESYELRTRSELMLADAEGQAEASAREQQEVRAEISKMEGYVQRLQGVLAKLRTAEADVGVRLSVQLQSAHLLKQSGVTYPQGAVRSGEEEQPK